MDTELYHVARLGQDTGWRLDPDDLHRVFGAPWRDVALVTVDESGPEPRDLHDSEVLLYTVEGRGTATLADGDRVALHPGVSVALLQGERLDLEPAPGDGLQVFLAELGVGGAER